LVENDTTVELRNGAVFGADGQLCRHGVVITGTLIFAVGEPSTATIGSRSVDASGLTVVSGLIDAHTHLTQCPGLGQDNESVSRS